MVIISITAPSKTGKTTFLEHLIPLLNEKNIAVGALKHCHHPLTFTENTDSRRLEKAGASPSFATIEPKIETLLPAFLQCDVLLVEGFRAADLPSIVLQRGSLDPSWKMPNNIMMTLDIEELEKSVHIALASIKSLLIAPKEKRLL